MFPVKADVVVAVAFVFVVFLFAADNYVFEITTCSNFVPPENITSRFLMFLVGIQMEG